MNPLFKRWPQSMLTLLVLAALATPAMAQRANDRAAKATAPAAEEETVSLNFTNADIDAVVRAIGKLSGKNFIVDPRVKGTINIVTNRPVARQMTYSILVSALRLQGYAVVEDRNVVKVIPEADAKLHGTPVGSGDSPLRPGSDRIITQVFQIKHESAAQLVQVVRPLVSPTNPVTVYPGNNSLVVTDYAENLAQVAQIIAAIDVPQGDSTVISVRHASAIDMANTLNRLFGSTAAAPAGNDQSQSLTILADARSNTLLVRTENRSKLQAVRSMAAQLDQPGALGTVRIIYLKNAEATKVAATLRAVLANDGSTGSAGGATPASNTANAPGNAAINNAGQSAGGNIGGGYVYADTASNSLVITGPDTVYNSVRRVVDQLDRRPAQVYIEALIAEVSAERAAEFGIQWQSGGDGGRTAVYGGTNFRSGTGSNILSIASGATPAAGLNFIVGGGTLNILGTEILDLNFLARFLESDSRTNILSTPSLVTLDNEEAKIVVGQNVPFVTGQYTSTGSAVTNPFQTIERKDVGLTLKVKPQITEGGTVRLKIFQEASSLSSTTSSSGLITNTRTLESNVIADDGAIIALGGLIEDKYTTSHEKVPLLGDIPLLGALFRYDTRTRSKTNLLIFLRPRILRTAEDSQSLSQDRYDYIYGKQQGANDASRTQQNSDGPGPSLPPPPPRSAPIYIPPAGVTTPAARPMPVE